MIKELIKKWQFWIVILIIIFVIVLFLPLKACGLIKYQNGVPTGDSVNIYISYFKYFVNGCVE